MASDKSQRLHRIYEKERRNTSSTDPKMMEARVFIGNLASDLVTRQDIEKMFEKYGKILGVSLHKSFGFVQFEEKPAALNAVKGETGNVLKGLTMDLCIATERRKDSDSPHIRGGPRRPRSRSPRRRRERDWERDRFDWLDRRLSPPPFPPRFRGRDPYFDREDPYLFPRDGPPFDRYPPFDPYDRYPEPRGYPRDFPPPPRRRDDRLDMDPWRPGGGPRPADRERHLDALDPPPVLKSTRSAEMEIIVVSQQQKEYAQRVRQQVESLGVLVEMKHLSPTFSLLEALDSAAKRGFLYTIIITSQHEAHRSVTLTILHGRNPQEHKNMPLMDAIGLVERDYDHYCHNIRMGGRGGPSPVTPRASLGMGGGAAESSTVGGSSSSVGGDNMTSLLAKAAAGGNLSQTELNSLISTLQEKQNSLQPETRPMPTVTQTTAEDIQQQQADLQAKILSLLGSNAVVPTGAGNKAGPSAGNNMSTQAAVTQRFGNDMDTGRTGMGNTGMSGIGSTGMSGMGNTGMSGLGNTGMSGIGNTGMSSMGNTGYNAAKFASPFQQSRYGGYR